MIKGLTIIMMNIINYQMLKNNYNKKFKPILKIMIMTDGLQKKI